jgi:ribonuclease VapC
MCLLPWSRLDARSPRAEGPDIGERELRLAIEAHSRYGKGRHPAALNLGDCFAYACAKANGARLLYVGDDFAKTDLA